MSIAPMPKPSKDITRKNKQKLQTNISHEHRCKNPKQNTNKSNSTMYEKNYTQQQSRIYSTFEE